MKASNIEAVFVVNLEKDVKKKNHMQRLCCGYDLSPNFLVAVDSAFLTKNEVDVVYSKDRAIKTIGRQLSSGEIGCALSHKKIYQKIVNENIELALILEDDVEFDKELLEVLKLVDEFPVDWEVVLLGHHGGASRNSLTNGSLWGQKYLSSIHKIIRPCEMACGTYGYLINQRGAAKLLADLECIVKPVDHYTGDSDHVNLYAIEPTPIRISDDLSDNYHSMEDRNKLVNNQNSLQDRGQFSWHKRLLISLGIFLVVRRFLEQVRRLVNKVKPLRKYKCL